MCHFILLVLTDLEKEALYAQALAANKRRLVRVENRSLAANLRRGEFTVHPQANVCDCGTALGSARDRPRARVSIADVEKRRKLGWTENKIRRWVDEKAKTEARDLRIRHTYQRYLESGGLDPDGWATTIAEILVVTNTEYVGVLLHWYSGSLEGERIDVAERRKLSLNEDAGRGLYEMREDTVYEVYE